MADAVQALGQQGMGEAHAPFFATIRAIAWTRERRERTWLPTRFLLTYSVRVTLYGERCIRREP
jgi:hypothetical protein